MMMSNYIEYIDINSIVREIKSNHALETVERTKEIVFDNLINGVTFRGKTIGITYRDYQNKFSNNIGRWYYFKCPVCEKNSRKMYVSDTQRVGCRKCCKIKSKTKINTQADRIFRIQNYLSELYLGKKITAKRKKQLINFIINHYNSLDPKYRFAYNTFVFKEIQNWCLDNLHNDEKNKDYKEAVKDMLSILRDSRKILVKSGLANSKNKKLEI